MDENYPTQIQNGRQVFNDVCPMVAAHISTHLAEADLPLAEVKRFWLHQANLGMNKLIAKTILGRDPEPGEAPVILDEYANTSSAGSVIAFHKYRDGLAPGDLGGERSWHQAGPVDGACVAHDRLRPSRTGGRRNCLLLGRADRAETSLSQLPPFIGPGFNHWYRGTRGVGWTSTSSQPGGTACERWGASPSRDCSRHIRAVSSARISA